MTQMCWFFVQLYDFMRLYHTNIAVLNGFNTAGNLKNLPSYLHHHHPCSCH